MTAEWEDVNFEVQPYKNTGTYIQKVTDDILQQIDDHIVLTQSMTFSPYKAAFEDRINRWEQTLRMTQVCAGTIQRTNGHPLPRVMSLWSCCRWRFKLVVQIVRVRETWNGWHGIVMAVVLVELGLRVGIWQAAVSKPMGVKVMDFSPQIHYVIVIWPKHVEFINVGMCVCVYLCMCVTFCVCLCVRARGRMRIHMHFRFTCTLEFTFQRP